MKYLVLVEVSNDKTGKRFSVGSSVDDKDFTKSVIKNWLKIGVLSKVKEPKKNEVVEVTSETNHPDGEEVSDG